LSTHKIKKVSICYINRKVTYCYVRIYKEGGVALLGSRLIFLRKERKKTQEDIAKIIGVTRPAYTAYETGKRNPDYDTLEKIADYYDVSIDYLLGRTEVRNPRMFESAGISNDEYKNLSPYQKEVVDFFLTREDLFFHDRPEKMLDALEQFEVFYEVLKKQEEKKQDKK